MLLIDICFKKPTDHKCAVLADRRILKIKPGVTQDERSAFWKVIDSIGQDEKNKGHTDMSCTKHHNRSVYLLRLTTTIC